MKKHRYIAIALVISLILLVVIPPSKAQEPPHPPTTGHGQQGNQNPGGTAPIGGGTLILMALGAFYASLKSLNSEKE